MVTGTCFDPSTEVPNANEFSRLRSMAIRYAAAIWVSDEPHADPAAQTPDWASLDCPQVTLRGEAACGRQRSSKREHAREWATIGEENARLQGFVAELTLNKSLYVDPRPSYLRSLQISKPPKTV